MKTSITITWDIEDVKSNSAYVLTDEQASMILEYVDDNHDAGLGVSWDTLDSAEEILIDEHNWQLLNKADI